MAVMAGPHGVELFLRLAAINAVSRRYFLQANDAADMRDWVAALNKASKITVSPPPHTESLSQSFPGVFGAYAVGRVTVLRG